MASCKNCKPTAKKMSPEHGNSTGTTINFSIMRSALPPLNDSPNPKPASRGIVLLVN
jgi:hypothetical protein